jgi:hypothetical protein
VGRIERQFVLWSLMLASAACARETDARDLRPAATLVDRIEAGLAGQACVGSLDRWERHYGFGGAGKLGPPDWGVERGRIVFLFREAGVYGFRPRRVLESERDGTGTDEIHTKYVLGEYFVRTGKLVIHECELGPTH